MAGIAVDMAKCYDSARLPLLRRLLAAAGWPAAVVAVAGPLLAAYGARRRLRKGMQLAHSPAPVLVFGPTAPSLMAMAGRCTEGTAWSRGRELDRAVATAAVWSATALFAAAAQLRISVAKSGAFASTASARADLQVADPSAPVLRSFKDLGIPQHAGHVGTTAAVARVQGTFARLDRLAGLPLPYAHRVQAVAAAGVVAAAYGAVVGTPSNRTLARLRTWAGRAVWRGRRFGAVELRPLLGGQALPRRPCRSVRVGTVVGICKALQRGWARTEDAQLLGQGAGRHPLAQALRRSTRTLPGGTWDPATAGLDATRAWLPARWRARAALAVSRRRPGFVAAAAGVGWAGAGHALAVLAASPARWAAARAAMVGDSVTATRRPIGAALPASAPIASTLRRAWGASSGIALAGITPAKEQQAVSAATVCQSPRVLPRLTQHSLLRSPWVAAAALVPPCPQPFPVPPRAPARDDAGYSVDRRRRRVACRAPP